MNIKPTGNVTLICMHRLEQNFNNEIKMERFLKRTINIKFNCDSIISRKIVLLE